ncbi:twin-arginine translocation signal domain-containing protein, partial [Candidatus Pyrohabitans sp.]
MQEIYDAVMDGRDISRRAFLKGTAVAGLMALGAGCLGKSDSPGKTPSHQNIEPPIPYYVNGRKIGEFHV